MDPSNNSMHIPTIAPRLPLMYNFLQVPPPIFPSLPNPMHEVGQPTMHSCAQLMELQGKHLQLFWQNQMLEMDHLAVYKQHQLPLARIKRIMKSDGSVKMISADAPVLFSKACELFILELTIRSWLHAQEHRRRTIMKSDIADAICHAEVLDFLIDIAPSDEIQDYISRHLEIPQQFVMTQQAPSSTGMINDPAPL